MGYRQREDYFAIIVAGGRPDCCLRRGEVRWLGGRGVEVLLRHEKHSFDACFILAPRVLSRVAPLICALKHFTPIEHHHRRVKNWFLAVHSPSFMHNAISSFRCRGALAVWKINGRPTIPVRRSLQQIRAVEIYEPSVDDALCRIESYTWSDS